MSRKQLLAMGFTCGKRANSACVKFLDDRCKTGTCKVTSVYNTADATLNGSSAYLDAITCTTTETDSALVNDCWLQLSPRRLLTPDSAFGKALIDKYGPCPKVFEPTADSHDTVGGGRMLWWNPDIGSNGPELEASCESPIAALTNEMTNKQCTIHLSDPGVSNMESEKQRDIDAQRKRTNQPAAPSL